jgi:DNA-binding transcriptional LysR family regulator
MKFDFDGVQAFVTIAEFGGFSRAASELHITQTALSRRLQKLENHLALRLLDRTTRQVRLTPVGREFLPQARAIVQQMTHAVERLRDISERSLGNVTLACIPTLTSRILPLVIKRYAKLHPDNRIQLVDGSSAEVREALLSGRAELGIALKGEPHPDLAESHWLTDPLVFVCLKSHPLAAKDTVSWSELEDVELVGLTGLATRDMMNFRLAERGIHLKTKYEVQHHATALNLVAAGVGTAVLPASALRQGDSQGLRALALDRPSVKRKVVLLRSSGSTLSPAAQALHEMLKEFVQP